MTAQTLTHGLLHHHILQFIIDKGYAPNNAELSSLLDVSDEVIVDALYALQEYHGVVLHPNSTKIWVVHPFALAPTNFVVRTDAQSWWGNCAWCSLGVAALLKQDAMITTTLGADGEQIGIHIRDGQVAEEDYVVHFPIPMTQAWDNVIYTCSNMLLFKDKADVERWCHQHRMKKGDVQPLPHIWDFAQVWYGNHLNPQWEKWTNQQAYEIFQRFNLTHDVWCIPLSDERF